jgi:hypothetical protein
VTNDPRYLTADGHPIVDGGIYWDNDLTRVRVVFHRGESPTSTEPGGAYWDGWFTTRRAEGPDTRTNLSNGERLAVRHPLTREPADPACGGTTARNQPDIPAPARGR